MHVVINVGRKVVVNDVIDIGDIETSCGNIGGDQNRESTRLEQLQRFFAFPLCAVTVDRSGGVSFIAESVFDLVSLALSLDEHQSEALLDLLFEQSLELTILVELLDVSEVLSDLTGGGAHAADCQEHIVVEEIASQGLHIAREGG